jgi:hypothetical protein
LIKDRAALRAFYDFPAAHWKHLRTINPIESSFATVYHRTTHSKGCPSNKTALAMIFKLAEAAGKLAPARWPQPVAESYPRCKVHRRDKGYIASSSHCRLTPSVTKMWRYLGAHSSYVVRRTGLRIFVHSSRAKLSHPWGAEITRRISALRRTRARLSWTIAHSSAWVCPLSWAACESTWNKDPVFGVIGIQSGPRG